jgi:ADP-ribosylglycohydrolase
MLATEDCFIGCVLGECAGDALGFPVEGWTPVVCADHVQRVVLGTHRPDAVRGGLPMGQYTDDSQLMRELLQSYVARRGFDPADYAQRIAAIFEEDRIVGRGAATERAAERIAAGVSWEESGEPAPIAGNGSAMRAGIVGLLARDDDELVQMAVDQGRITHRDPRASAGAVAVASACAQAAAGEVDVERIAALCERVDAGFAGHVRRLPTWIEREPGEAVKEIGTVGKDFEDRWEGISPFVVSSVLWSLYSYLRAPDDWSAAVGCAIAVGGDVDTTGAMTGAIAGAKLGASAPPSWILERLTDRGDWGRAELEELARAARKIREETT